MSTAIMASSVVLLATALDWFDQLSLAAVVSRLGWTLVHSLWQFLAVAALGGLMLWWLRRSTAQLRYVVACLTMTAMVVLVPVTFWRVAHDVYGPFESGMPSISGAWTNDVSAGSSASDATSLLTSSPSSVSEIRGASGDHSVTAANDHLAQLTSFIAAWLSTIVVVWAVGVCVVSIRLCIGWRGARSLRRCGWLEADAQVQALVHKLAARLRVRRAVQIVQSRLVEVPAVIGWLRPLILLPASVLSGLSTPQLEAILAHELAHIRRHDYLVNVLQTLVETLFFYHPAVWWISQRIRTEREHCCDDVAMALCGSRAAYAGSLLALEQLRALPPQPALSAASGNLLSRIRRIALGDSEMRPRTAEWLLLPVLAVAVLLSVWAASRQTTTAQESPSVRNSAPTDSPDGKENSRLPGYDFGKLTGQFVITGELPEQNLVPVYAPQSREDSIAGRPRRVIARIPDESLLVDEQGGLANVFVYLVSANAPEMLIDEPKTVEMRSEGYRFEPRAIAFPLGSDLRLVNPHEEATNFHMAAVRGTPFNLLIPPKAEVIVEPRGQESVPIRVTCSIKPWMLAWILPRENNWQTVSATDGSFTIDKLPIGEWEFRVWHEKLGFLNRDEWPKGRFRVEIHPGNNDLGRIELPASKFFPE